MERLFPESTSTYAEEGTLAHAWAAHLLDPDNQPKPTEECPEENMKFVRDYVDFVNRETDSDMRDIECKVDLQAVTGEHDAKGTIDCVSLVDNTLKIIDLKFGRGVHVTAHDNPQLLIYALAALEIYKFIDDVKTIEMTIFQPRMDNIDTWKIDIGQVDHFAQLIRTKAAEAFGYLNADPLPPEALRMTEAGCQFCRAMACCPQYAKSGKRVYREEVAKSTDFEPIEDESQEPVPMMATEILSPAHLAENLKMADLLEPWIKSVRDEAKTRMMNGDSVPGFKLVLGRAGNRQWTDSKEAESMLKTFKLKEDERYTFKVISPTQAEKLYKAGRIGERQWKKAENPITRSAPQPTLAPETDKRAAWSPVAKPTDFSLISD